MREKHSEWFEVGKAGVYSLTVAFIVFLGVIVKEAREGFKEGVRLGEENVKVLLFADDMVLVAGSEEFLQVNLTKLDEVSTKWEMKMNWEKTEVVKVGKESRHCCVDVGDRKLESAVGVRGSEEFGSDDKWRWKDMEEGIRSRIGKAARVIGVLNEPVWKHKELNRRSKLKVYNAIVVCTHTDVWK